jgi:hypothetical protein
VTEAAVQAVLERFGGAPNVLTRELEKLRLELRANPDGLDMRALRERNKTRSLAFLNGRLSLISWLRGKCEKREENAEAAAVLPSMEVLDKILRYETKLERQLFRAMAQLERLQRMRRGEEVPAPLSVEVSERG